MLRRFVTLIAISLTLLIVGCGDDAAEERCEPGDANACGAGERCVADGNDGVCEELDSCDPDVASSCPDGFVCRPLTDRAVCEPQETAGRIPSCIDSEGIDVFAVEASRALSVSWNVRGDFDHSGGFRVEYGTTSEEYDESVEVGAEVRQTSLRPLENGVEHYVAVQALDSDGEVAHASCELTALPHVLEFQPDLRVNTATDGDQSAPTLGANGEGTRLYLAWQSESAIEFAVSDDFGDTWTDARVVASGAEQASPDLVVRNAVEDDDGEVVTPETVFIAWEDSGDVMLGRYHPGDDTFDDPVTVAAGGSPNLAVSPDRLHVAFEKDGEVFHTSSGDDGQSFELPVKISGNTSQAAAPVVATSALSGDVYIGWHGVMGQGDTDIYFAGTPAGGTGFAEPVQVDDDTSGQNQKHVSIAIDERSQTIYATWEDRRGGANVYFSWSEDWGATWEPSVDVGAGLGGDQFQPQAVIDVAGNVYVAMQDTTDGARVIFTRFNSEGSFDPPLAPSSEAGSSGTVADHPVVATDRYGAVYVAWEENRGGPDTDIIFARAE